MAERPTPYSISVCTLIALHSDPSSPLHNLIIQEDHNKKSNEELGRGNQHETENLQRFLEDCVLGGRRNPQGNDWSLVQATTLSTFYSELQGTAGYEIASLLLDYVTMAASSIDSLMDLMDSLRIAVTDGVVDGTSANGILLRKITLGFDQLSFETITILWNDLQQQIENVHLDPRQQKDQLKREENSSSNNWAWPLSHTQLERALRKECFKLETQSNRDHASNNSSSSSSYEQTELQIMRVLQHDPELPSAHFLRFLNSIKHGERVKALEALHQYFDYAIIKDRRGGAIGIHDVNSGNNDNNMNSNNSEHDQQANNNNNSQISSRQQDILQYAAVLLASLHYSFGDNALAKLATDEAVRVAQQSMDAACVAFALGWIFNTEQEYQSNNDAGMDKAELLARCSSRAVQGNLRPLAAGASLSLAKHYLSSTMTTNGSSYYSHDAHLVTTNGVATDNIARSTTSNNANNVTSSNSNAGIISSASLSSSPSSSSSALASAAWTCLADALTDPRLPSSDSALALDRPSHVTDGTTSAEVSDILARQRLVSAGIWDYFGQSSLSGISSFLALYSHADHMLSKDVVTAIQNIVRLSLYGSPLLLLSKKFYGSVLHDHIQNIKNNAIANPNLQNTDNASRNQGIAALKIEEEDSPSTPVSCIYAQALLKLIGLWRAFELPTMDTGSGLFQLSACFILHEWAIRRGELNQAEAFGIVLESLIYPGMYDYQQVLIDVFIQKALLYTRQGKFEDAKKLTRRLINLTAGKSTTNYHYGDYEKKNNDGNALSPSPSLRTYHVKLLLQLAIIELESNPHYFTSALSPLLQCLSLSNKYEMDALHATALSILAQIHYRMKNPKRAISLVQAALPSLLQQEHVWYQGEAFLTMAKCHLQLAKNSRTKTAQSALKQAEKERNEENFHNESNHTRTNVLRLLKSTCKELEQSEEFFRKCHDCYRLREVFHLQACVYDMMRKIIMTRNHHQQQQKVQNYKNRRDAASQEFLNVSNHLTVMGDQHRNQDSRVLEQTTTGLASVIASNTDSRNCTNLKSIADTTDKNVSSFTTSTMNDLKGNCFGIVDSLANIQLLEQLAYLQVPVLQ